MKVTFLDTQYSHITQVEYFLRRDMRMVKIFDGASNVFEAKSCFPYSASPMSIEVNDKFTNIMHVV